MCLISFFFSSQGEQGPTGAPGSPGDDGPRVSSTSVVVNCEHLLRITWLTLLHTQGEDGQVGQRGVAGESVSMFHIRSLM